MCVVCIVTGLASDSWLFVICFSAKKFPLFRIPYLLLSLHVRRPTHYITTTTGVNIVSLCVSVWFGFQQTSSVGAKAKSQTTQLSCFMGKIGGVVSAGAGCICLVCDKSQTDGKHRNWRIRGRPMVTSFNFNHSNHFIWVSMELRCLQLTRCVIWYLFFSQIQLNHLNDRYKWLGIYSIKIEITAFRCAFNQLNR